MCKWVWVQVSEVGLLFGGSKECVGIAGELG